MGIGDGEYDGASVDFGVKNKTVEEGGARVVECCRSAVVRVEVGKY